MLFSQIPVDLQDIIFDFAWRKRTKDVQHSLDVVLELKRHNLPANFYHAMVWSWIEQKFVPLPLVVFSPVDEFRHFFNFPRIRCILMQLDFRKRHVKAMGNRIFWLKFSSKSHEPHLLSQERLSKFLILSLEVDFDRSRVKLFLHLTS